jgi:molybdate transport system substrate-binding protein
MLMSVRLRVSRIVLALVVFAAPVGAEEVTVYAAASLTDALGELSPGFEARTGHKIVFSFGASNDLARQIKAGAPADVFFSADRVQMDGLESAGFVQAKDRVDLLSNVLVAVIAASSTMKMSQPAELLAVGLWEKVKDRVVPTLNVRAALSAVESESADAGIVYRTDAAISKRVKVAFEVPREQGPAIVYPLAALTASKKAATNELVRYLVSADAREVYAHYGFLVLPGK